MTKIANHLLTNAHSPPSYENGHEPDTMSLNHLARRALRGNATALRALLRVLRPRVMRVLHRQGVPQHDRDDLMSEIAFKLHANLPHLISPDSNIEAWIGRVARNHVLDYHERRSRGRSPTAVDVVGLPSQSYTVGAEHLDAMRHFGMLTGRERTVFELHLLGYRHDEIGKEVGISAESSRRILADARARLRQELRGHACVTHGA